MKRAIRRNLFESNSSSTHSLVIMSDNEHTDWMCGRKWLCRGNWLYRNLLNPPGRGKLYNKDEVRSFISQIGETENNYSSEDELFYDNDFESYDIWSSNEYLEYEDAEYVTSSGEKIIVCCKYGFEG